ncbi:MAG: hypothetical protein AABX49_01395 [Nanoarchaeota archaeon]
MKFLNLFLESWRLVWNKKILAVYGIEFLFFLLMAVNVTVSFSIISENFNELKNFEQGFSVDENASTDYIYRNLLFLSGVLDEIFIMAIVSFAISFLLFGFFMGITWMWSVNLVHKKNLFKDYHARYFLKFYLLVLIWFAILAAGFYLLYQSGFNYAMLAVILILFFYFVWINFSCFAINNNWAKSFLNGVKLSVRRCYIFIPAFLTFLVLLAISSYLLGIFGNYFVSLLGSFLGVFIFIWFRIFLIVICKEFTESKHIL